MRIIKFEEVEQQRGKISSMIFPDFALEGDPGDNGGARSGLDPQQMEMQLEKVKKEAEALRVKAAEDAENVRNAAEKEAEKIREQARQEAQQTRDKAAQDAEVGKKEGFSAGYSSGEEEGYKKGYDEGFQKGKVASMEEARATINMMKEVIDQLKTYHAEILGDAQTDIAKMALSVAAKVLQKEIMTDPMTVVSVVKAALARVSFKKNFVVNVNPLDLEVIESAGADVKAMLDNYESLEFKANPQVQAGGCVVQTESGTVDAQIDRQFDEVKDAVYRAMDANGQ